MTSKLTVDVISESNFFTMVARFFSLQECLFAILLVSSFLLRLVCLTVPFSILRIYWLTYSESNSFAQMSSDVASFSSSIVIDRSQV